MKKLLFLTRIIPNDDAVGGDIPILNLQMKALKNSDFKFDLLFLRRTDNDTSSLDRVKNNLGFKEIYYADIRAKLSFKSVFDWIFSNKSYIFNRFYSEEYSDKLYELVKTGGYSAIVITTSYLYINIFRNKKLQKELKSRNIKCILGVHVLEHQVLENYIRLNKISFWKKIIFGREAALIKNMEISFVNLADRTFFVGKEDLSYFEKYFSDTDNLKLLEIIPDIERYKYVPFEFEQENSIYFVGSYSWKPNVDAVRHFINDIFPFVLRKNNAVKLYLIGAGFNEEIKSFHNGKNIFFIGKVEDVYDEIKKYSMMIAPIRIGGGTRLKVLDALAAGKPIIATSKALEGINLQNNKPLIIEDNAEDFANQILTLLSDNDKRVQLKRQARDFAENYYKFEQFKNNFLEILQV